VSDEARFWTAVTTGDRATVESLVRARPELATARRGGVSAVLLAMYHHKPEVAACLRARLESQSLITGTLFVNMGLFPDTPVKLSEVDPADGYPEIPTVPTQLAEVGKSVTAILARLETVDLAGMASSIDRAASSIERLTSSEKVSEALARVSTTLGSYEKLGRHLDEGLRPVVSDLQAAIADARKTLLALNGVTGDARRLVAPDAAVSVRLGEALNEVGRAASAIRELADYLQRNPNALLVGKSR